CLSSSIMPDARQLHPFPTRRSSDLAAYQEAGFTVGAIASRNVEKTKKIAERYGIGKVHETPETLIADPAVEILDIAYPPDLQPALIRQALKQDHIKGILAQKPLALSLEEAIKLDRKSTRL